jgi:hypothetical protein
MAYAMDASMITWNSKAHQFPFPDQITQREVPRQKPTKRTKHGRVRLLAMHFGTAECIF